MTRFIVGLVVAMLILIAALLMSTRHYRENAITYKKQRDGQVQKLRLANATLADMVARQHALQALDTHYQEAITHAQAESEKLRADLAAGRRRLQLSATCVPTGEQGRTAAGGADATAPRLTPDAEQNYQRLVEQLTRVTAQVRGLQQYITEQCH
ncbi:lysis protein [Edwardsiella tarda]|uniref:lysis protein n=1 Tax=Edwardsiella tarda TaxID=636 RepID=UPI002445274A|nr:lysis protein [Edwardsiella tarda]WGE29417.1 lysis protein [Edwardsiella tarda]